MTGNGVFARNWIFKYFNIRTLSLHESWNDLMMNHLTINPLHVLHTSELLRLMLLMFLVTGYDEIDKDCRLTVLQSKSF